jgi:hypothetical protein
MLARVMPDALPGIRFLAIAASQIGALAEMAADDSAARHYRLPLARALLALAATSPVPASVLGAAPPAGGMPRGMPNGPRCPPQAPLTATPAGPPRPAGASDPGEMVVEQATLARVRHRVVRARMASLR